MYRGGFHEATHHLHFISRISLFSSTCLYFDENSKTIHLLLVKSFHWLYIYRENLWWADDLNLKCLMSERIFWPKNLYRSQISVQAPNICTGPKNPYRPQKSEYRNSLSGNRKFSVQIFRTKNPPKIRIKILLMRKDFSQNCVHAQIDPYVEWEHCTVPHHPQESRKIVEN